MDYPLLSPNQETYSIQQKLLLRHRVNRAFHINRPFQDEKSYRSISPSHKAIVYQGRVVKHFLVKEDSMTEMRDYDYVEFDWTGVCISIQLCNVGRVGVKLKGEGNYFNIYINGKFNGVIKTTDKPLLFEVATNLNLKENYIIKIQKRTEPYVRGATSVFKPCYFYGFVIQHEALILPYELPYSLKFEFIGDADVTAYGNEGQLTSTINLYSMCGRFQNAANGYPEILSRMFNAESHILGWTGKGVHSNAVDWGPTMSTLWRKTLAAKPTYRWDMFSWMPDAVFINLGINDMLLPTSSETEILHAYTRLLIQVRRYRPRAHIFCITYAGRYVITERSEAERCQILRQLHEIIRVAMAQLRRNDYRLHCILISSEEFDESDYAVAMRLSVQGHLKIAQCLAGEIQRKTGWEKKIEDPIIYPFPTRKRDLLDVGHRIIR